MASRLLALLGLPLLALGACGSDDVAPAPGAGGSTSSSGGPGGGGDGGNPTPDPTKLPDGGTITYPAGEGDPCRGTPLTEDAFTPEKMCTRLVANEGLNGLRQLAFAPNGDILGVTSGGKILLFRDADKNGVYAKAEITTWGDTGGNGNNAHIDVEGGFVYAGAPAGVKRFPWDPAAPKGGAAENVIINMPGGGHGKITAHVYDGFLYVDSGSSGNQSHDDQTKGQYDGKRSLIRRFELAKLKAGTPFDWNKDGENVSLGLRNANGFKRNELTGKIYTVVNGLDNITYKGADVHMDNPGEQLAEVAPGKNYGYPFCFTAQRVVDGDVVTPGKQLTAKFAGAPANDDAWCAANSVAPTTFFQAHSAPLDLVFFDKQPSGALPEKWRGGAFVALHGSWNREGAATGYKVVWQPFNADGTSPLPTSTKDTTTFPHEIVFGGADDKGAAKDGPWQWTSTSVSDSPRPAGVAISPIDGALYIATDSPGALYRIGLTR